MTVICFCFAACSDKKSEDATTADTQTVAASDTTTTVTATAVTTSEVQTSAVTVTEVQTTTTAPENHTEVVGEWTSEHNNTFIFYADGTGKTSDEDAFFWKYDATTGWYMISCEGLLSSVVIETRDALRCFNIDGDFYYYKDDFQKGLDMNIITTTQKVVISPETVTAPQQQTYANEPQTTVPPTTAVPVETAPQPTAAPTTTAAPEATHEQTTAFKFKLPTFPTQRTTEATTAPPVESPNDGYEVVTTAAPAVTEWYEETAPATTKKPKSGKSKTTRAANSYSTTVAETMS